MGTVMSRLHCGRQMFANTPAAICTRSRDYITDEALVCRRSLAALRKDYGRNWSVRDTTHRRVRLNSLGRMAPLWRCNTSPVRGLMISSKQLPLVAGRVA